jgi:hypothetical protein
VLVDLSAPDGATLREVRADVPGTPVARPRYDLDLKLDWKLLSFRASGDIAVPVRRGDSVRRRCFFVFANAGGVGGGDGSHRTSQSTSFA